MASIPCVKICGVKHAEHVAAAADAGARAIGLNFVQPSSRYIGGARQAAALMQSCSGFSIEWAGVFVNPEFDDLMALNAALGFHIIQLHGDETPEFVRRVKSESGAKIWKAFRVATKKDLAMIADFECDGVVLDAKIAGTRGGTGQAFDWSILNDFKRNAPLVLSGGLNPNNVADAISAVKPEWVDVASGVESAPGIKDSTLIRSFATAAFLAI